jgi:hypothetical protein
MRFGRISGALAWTLAAVLSPAHAADAPYRGQVVVERSAAYRGYDDNLPRCSDPSVESRVTSRFAQRERGYWNSALQLSPFQRTAEIGYRSWGYEFIPRRFCSAHTVTNDGRRREVYYVISNAFGLGGITWGVEWCVTGLDRSYAFAPNCKMAQP